MSLRAYVQQTISDKITKPTQTIFEQIRQTDAGVIQPIDHAIFQNHGYMGLYGGLDAKGIHKRKGLKKSEQILDHMGSTELTANFFYSSQKN